uniref:leukocyte cell-derived chemotaxin-2 isoform X2 n=1 Tax=Myodes glareolus TaxID=447135 RepID=UPI002020E95F|nr:leukocyte cell-derived chemotaxin-2 isoform X2 [Myodes glareolus]
MFSTTVLIAAALISTALAGPWANICASKSSNEIRTCDSYGCGQYSAPRTNRHHPGVDVLCSDGSVVYAPFTGMIVGQEKPYRNKNAINNGLRLSGRGISLARCLAGWLGWLGSHHQEHIRFHLPRAEITRTCLNSQLFHGL